MRIAGEAIFILFLFYVVYDLVGWELKGLVFNKEWNL